MKNKHPFLFEPTRIDGESGGVLNTIHIDAVNTDESDVRALASELMSTGKYRVRVLQWSDAAEEYSELVI